MNQEDREFVEEYCEYEQLGERYNFRATPLLTEKELERIRELSRKIDPINTPMRLIAIIRKQSQALEKCKSQRDEWIEDHCWEPTNKLQQVMTYEKLVEIQNKELEEILKE